MKQYAVVISGFEDGLQSGLREEGEATLTADGFEIIDYFSEMMVGFFIDEDNKMNVVGHNHTPFNAYKRVYLFDIGDTIEDDITDGGTNCVRWIVMIVEFTGDG